MKKQYLTGSIYQVTSLKINLRNVRVSLHIRRRCSCRHVLNGSRVVALAVWFNRDPVSVLWPPLLYMCHYYSTVPVGVDEECTGFVNTEAQFIYITSEDMYSNSKKRSPLIYIYKKKTS